MLAAKTLSLADSIDSCFTLFAEITESVTDSNRLPVVCVVDNHSLVEAIRVLSQLTKI